MALPTLILGGGLTGISAGLHLKRPYRLFEKENRLGGLARTEQKEGFFFDHTGHWLHLRDAEIKRLTEKLLGDQMVEVARIARVYSHGTLTRYPFQGNLHGLPVEVVNECLLGYLRTVTEPDSEPIANFEQYIYRHFGKGIAEHFMIPYNWKLWGVHPREISTAWCQRFVPRPNLEQVVAGALGAGPPELGYNIRFRYPKQGGIETFSKALIAQLKAEQVHTATQIDRIKAAKKIAMVAGEEVAYHSMISSIPLPQLVGLIDDLPDSVQQAATKLRATALRYLNVAVKKPVKVDYHWVYVPEQRYPFYRVGIFSNAVSSMAPAGCASLYVELSGLLDSYDDETRKNAIAGLVDIGVIDSAEDVLFADWRTIDPAYVIFDEAYHNACDFIHAELEKHHIYSKGRYGSWIYNAMENSLLAGKQTAATVDAL